MKTPPKLKNEAGRLQSLATFEILDTLPEPDYDNITAIAAEICRAKLCLITMVDAERQWFKSHHGLDICETPIEYSFCGHAIYNNLDIFILEDTRLDDRFFDNPFVVGEPNVIFYAGVPLITSEGYPLGTLCITDDAPRKLSENQIFSLKALAYQVVNLLELRRKKNQLEEANLLLVRKNKELEQFTYIASHDLQEPIRTIKNFGLYLNNKHGVNLDETSQKSLSFIMDASDRMSMLVKELLDYSLIGKQSSLVELDADEVIQSIKNDFSLAIEETQAEIEVGNLPVVTVYEVEFRSLLQNLISNAIKFSRPNCLPRVTISAEELNNSWTFQVKDNGIGIADDHKEKIFKIFQRLHLKEAYKGTGIGLSHCKKIIELHQGEIWVDSKIGEGSSFCFTIPKKQLCKN